MQGYSGDSDAVCEETGLNAFCDRPGSARHFDAPRKFGEERLVDIQGIRWSVAVVDRFPVSLHQTVRRGVELCEPEARNTGIDFHELSLGLTDAENLSLF